MIRRAVERLAVPAATALLLAAASSACTRVSTQEARHLVERYNRAVCEAYRRGDPRLVDAVVGPREGKKLTGLIGVRLDLGLTLDAELTLLEVSNAERIGDQLHVWTHETWRYRDRRIGSGEQVGEESTDAYEMLYRFVRLDGDWKVDAIEFTKDPAVGRRTSPWAAPAEVLHGIETQAPAAPDKERGNP